MQASYSPNSPLTGLPSAGDPCHYPDRALRADPNADLSPDLDTDLDTGLHTDLRAALRTESRADGGGITALLQRHHAGDREAFDRMVPLVYDQLRLIAHRQLVRGERRGSLLDTTSLVQEAYLDLVSEHGVDWRDRGHFFAICARAMRRILVDDARRRLAIKRGGDLVEVTLEADMLSGDEDSLRVLAVEDALQELAAFSPKLAKLVECRFFAGMTEEETAAALHTSLRTVQRDWMRARAWLNKALATP